MPPLPLPTWETISERVVAVPGAIRPVFEISPSFLQSRASPLGEVAVGGLAVRHAILREVILVLWEFELAHLGDGHGVQKRLRQVPAENIPHLSGGTDVELPLFVLEPAFFVNRLARANANEDVVRAPVILHQIVTVVGCGQRYPGFL